VASNRLTNATYDANGNMTSGAGATLTHHSANRIASASLISGGIEYDEYASDNERIYRQTTDGYGTWTLYGAHSERVGTFGLGAAGPQYRGPDLGRSIDTISA
jgi:hypothetical protein